jgi:hypothetical protein
MAYMSQENKRQLAPGIKAVLKKYKMKGTLGVDNHSTLVCSLKSGPLNLVKNYQYVDINHYWLERDYQGKELAFLRELRSAMMVGNHDNSDIQTDYFDVGWYVSIKAGMSYDRPYVQVEE